MRVSRHPDRWRHRRSFQNRVRAPIRCHSPTGRPEKWNSAAIIQFGHKSIPSFGNRLVGSRRDREIGRADRAGHIRFPRGIHGKSIDRVSVRASTAQQGRVEQRGSCPVHLQDVNPEDSDVPGFSVFSRRDGIIRHFYSGEMSGAMADPGQDPRGGPDLEIPLRKVVNGENSLS